MGLVGGAKSESLAEDVVLFTWLVDELKCANLDGCEEREDGGSGDGDAVVPCEAAKSGTEVCHAMGDGLRQGNGQAGSSR